MKKTLLLLICLQSLSFLSKGQTISPTDLMQMNRLWQANVPHCDRTTVQYLLSVDSNWKPRGKPTVDESGYMLLLGYSRDHKDWYNPTEVQVTLSFERGTLKKSLIYGFTDETKWNAYLAQMVKMGATKLGSGPSQGGQQTMFQINDLVFILIEFPPGTNGTDKSYQVCLMRGT
jgi:hypothetical protein